MRGYVGGTLEDHERVVLAADVAEVAPIGAQHVGVVAHGAMLVKDFDRTAERLVGVRVVCAGARFCDRPPGLAVLVWKVDREFERPLPEVLCFLEVADPHGARRLQTAEDGEVAWFRPRSQETFCLTEMAKRRAALLSGDHGC